MASRTWLHKWLTVESIFDIDAVHSALDRKASVDRLVDLAEADRETVKRPAYRSTHTYDVLAGRSLDLSGYLYCPNPECRKKQVDGLFSRVCHYFDKILVVGPDSHAFLDLYKSRPPEDGLPLWKRMIVVEAGILFHVDNTGANELVDFVYKPPACAGCWPEFRDIHSLRLSPDIVHRLARGLLESGRVEVGSDDERQVVLWHPLLRQGREILSRTAIENYSDESLPLPWKAALNVVHEYWLGAASDLFASEQQGVPLGAGIPFELQVIRELRPATTAASVAFNLELPVLQNLPPTELLALRRSEREHFEAFQQALRLAIKERIAAAGSEADSLEVAREIDADLITPALTSISRQLSTAQDLLIKKYGLTIALGGLATICGVVGLAPLSAVAGSAAVANASAAALKVMEERREASLNDMYFLWKAHNHPMARTR